MGAKTDGPTGEDGMRQCAVTRQRQPREELLRFVAGPDGQVVPDLKGRLPGRGVWITPTAVCIGRAVEKGVFARALKQPVTAPAELVAQVETLLAKRVVGALALANKAGAVVSGFAKVEAALNSGRAKVLLHAAEAAEDGMEKLDRRARAGERREGRPIQIVRDLTQSQIGLALGRTNVIHAALTDDGAAAAFLRTLQWLQRYGLATGSTGGRSDMV